MGGVVGVEVLSGVDLLWRRRGCGIGVVGGGGGVVGSGVGVVGRMEVLMLGGVVLWG